MTSLPAPSRSCAHTCTPTRPTGRHSSCAAIEPHPNRVHLLFFIHLHLPSCLLSLRHFALFQPIIQILYSSLMPILFITSSPNYNFILNDYYKLILIISISKGDLQQRILSCFGAVHRNVENIWTLNARTMTPVYNTNSRGNILAQMKYEGTYEHIRCYQCSCPSCRNT